MQRRAWGLVALGIIGAVGAWLYFRHHTEQRVRTAIAEAAAAFTQCTVGEDSLEGDVGTALERRRLALSGAPRAWVLDCAARADELVGVLVDAGAADEGSRWHPLLERARAVADGVAEHDEYLVLSEDLVGPLLEAVASSDLPAVAASEPESSPPVARPALVELDLSETLPSTGYPVRTDPVPSRMVRLLLEYEWCEYDPRDPSNGLRCHPRPCQLCDDAFFASAPDVPGFAGVVDPSSPGRASDVDTLFVTDGPERPLELETGQITSAHVEPGGAMVAMGSPGIRFRADGFERVVRTPGDTRWRSWVLWDAIVEGDSDPGPWTVRTVPAAEEPETPRLAMTSGRTVHPRACRDDAGLAVAVQVVEPAGGASDVTLRFRRSGEWSPAVAGRVRWSGFGFSRLGHVAETYLPMVCTGGAATFTGFSDGIVEQLRCTPEDGCSVARSGPIAAEPPTSSPEAVRAVPLGERVLLVRRTEYWGGLGSLTSTIRYRLAPVEDLAEAEEHVLAGSTHRQDGLSLGSRIETFSRGSEALVIFGDPALAVRFDADGTVRQVPVER